MAAGSDFGADADPDTVAAAIESTGYAIVHGVLDAATVARFVGELQPHIAAAELGQTAFLGSRTRR
jgi:hypothetical protein